MHISFYKTTTTKNSRRALKSVHKRALVIDTRQPDGERGFSRQTIVFICADKRVFCNCDVRVSMNFDFQKKDAFAEIRAKQLGSDTRPKYGPARHKFNQKAGTCRKQKSLLRQQSQRNALKNPGCEQMTRKTLSVELQAWARGQHALPLLDSNPIPVFVPPLLSLDCTLQRMFMIPALSRERFIQFKAFADVHRPSSVALSDVMLPWSWTKKAFSLHIFQVWFSFWMFSS